MHSNLSRFMAKQARWLSHVAFWVCVLGFYTFYFGQRQDNYNQSLFFICLLLPITVVTTYFLLYWLIPRYLLQRRYFTFALYFVYTLLMSFYLELVLVLALYVSVAEYQAMFVRPGIVDLLTVIISMYLVVSLAAALHLLKRWYSMQQENMRLEQIRMETELKLKDAELHLLRSQIHPHFLFNTLNNLYGLSLEQSEKVPEVVLQISSLLDYMLYRSDSDRVPLSEEIEHIRNYLGLEQLRYDDRSDISFNVDGDPTAVQIAPLLLIPFVENSIKHGIGQAPGYVNIDLTIQGQNLSFSVSNSTPAKPSDSISTASGIGLSNVKRRLELLYPKVHTLSLREDTDSYSIELNIHLDERIENAMPDRG